MRLFKQLGLVFLCFCSTFAMAQSLNHFSAKRLWLSGNEFYSIKAENEVLGYLINREGQMPLMYELFDVKNNKLTTVNYSYTSTNDHFDIYDVDGALLGATDEFLYRYFPMFNLYQGNSNLPIAKAQMNFWGTRFSIVDPQTQQEMAEMTRSYFRKSSYWKFAVTNNQLFDSKHIDSRLLMTAVAIQTDPVLKKTSHQSNFKNGLIKSATKPANAVDNEILDHIKAVQAKLGLEIANVDLTELNAVAKKLDLGFSKEYPDSVTMEQNERLNLFVHYCLDRAESNQTASTEKKAIFYMLLNQFEKS